MTPIPQMVSVVKTVSQNHWGGKNFIIPLNAVLNVKSKNVWTLYYFENYVADSVDSFNDLLNQKLYEQKILPVDSTIKELDGVALASNISYLLSIESNTEKLNNNLIEGEI